MASFCLTTSISPSEALPLSGSCSVARMRMSVDLPAPLGPSSPYIPDGIVSVTSLSACTPLEYVFDTPRICNSSAGNCITRDSPCKVLAGGAPERPRERRNQPPSAPVAQVPRAPATGPLAGPPLLQQSPNAAPLHIRQLVQAREERRHRIRAEATQVRDIELRARRGAVQVHARDDRVRIRHIQRGEADKTCDNTA